MPSATHIKDLRTGASLWMSRRLPMSLPCRPLRQDAKADVVVIGAGISGALVADALSDEGLDVIILDRRGPLKGSTPASTALLQYEIDTPLSKLIKTVGKDTAQRIWRRSRLALDALRERARHLGIKADLINRDSLYLEGNLLSASDLKEEALCRREAGFEVTYLTAAQVQERYGISGRSALLGYDNLSADPRRLAAGFLKTALDRGARLYAPCMVETVEPSSAGVDVVLESGRCLRAGHVVFATGYELAKGVPRKGHTIVSTWAMATPPQTRRLWPDQCFIWEASDPYLYLRTSPDGRVICGGEDEEFSDEETRDALMDRKIAAIQKKLGRLFPDIDVTAAYQWCGCFGASETGSPSIGRVPGMANCFALMGYGGNGITFSMVGAQLLASLITGRTDPDRDLFSFSRDF